MSSIEKKMSRSSVQEATQSDIGETFDVPATNVLTEEQIGDAAADKRLLRKIDMFLLPLLTVSYMLQFLDKQTLNFSSIMGLIKDLHLKGTQYSWASCMFYFGYLVFSYPASFLMVRLPLGKYLAATCIIWAACLACHAATTNFTGLMIVRFFLGASEASISPGFSLITGMWYKRQEQPLRHGIWFFGNSVALMVGGLLAYAIAHIHSSISTWKWLFIIFGILTLVWSILLLVFLPDSPAQSRLFTPEEKVRLVNRIRDNQTGMKDNTFKWDQAREAVTDIKVWLLVLFMFANCIPNGALTSFSSIVITGFGFSKLETYLLNMPSGACHAIFSLGATYLCGRFKNARCWIAVSLSVISLIGSILVRYGPNQGAKLFGLLIFVAFAAGIPITMSMISSNIAGFTKKTVTSAMVFIAYCCGNIIGPFLFFPSEAPTYSSGFLATTICFALAVIFMFCLRLVFQYENKRRDQLQAANQSSPAEKENVSSNDLLAVPDLTDGKNMTFRYLL